MKFLLSVCVISSALFSGGIGHPCLDQDQKDIITQYQMDETFINEFPFRSYRIVQTKLQGSFYVNKRRPDIIKTKLLQTKAWEMPNYLIIKKYVKPGTVVIDAGAHIGTHTITMSNCVGPEGLVFSFEPQQRIHRELCQNIKANNCGNIIPLHVALGDKKGEAYMEPERKWNEGYRSISTKYLSEKILTMTLDELHLENVSFMKIDVEAYEKKLLEGARQTILLNRPVILIEIGGGSVEDVGEGIDPHDHYLLVKQMLEEDFGYSITKVEGRHVDYLAIPN